MPDNLSDGFCSYNKLNSWSFKANVKGCDIYVWSLKTFPAESSCQWQVVKARMVTATGKAQNLLQAIEQAVHCIGKENN